MIFLLITNIFLQRIKAFLESNLYLRFITPDPMFTSIFQAALLSLIPNRICQFKVKFFLVIFTILRIFQSILHSCLCAVALFLQWCSIFRSLKLQVCRNWSNSEDFFWIPRRLSVESKKRRFYFPDFWQWSVSFHSYCVY